MNFGLFGFPKVPGFDALAKAVSVSGSTSAPGQSAWSQSGTTFNMKAGVDSPAGSLMCIGADGLGYPAQTADYAIKTGAFDSVIASTTVVSGAPGHSDRANILQAANGDIIIASAYYTSGAPYGIALYRYTASGALQGSVLIESNNTTCYDPQMYMLSNGNIVVSYSETANLRFAVVTQALAVVKAATQVEALGGSHRLTALSGGGFMLAWHDKAVATNYNLSVFDNAGAVVSQKAVIRTITGGTIYTRGAQLSNGNVAMLIVANNISYVGIVSPLGAVVLPFSAADALTGSAVDINALPGYFALVGRENGSSSLKMRIYSNAGVQQGATALFPTSTSSPTGARIVNDGANFWLAYHSSTTVQNLARVTTSAEVSNWVIEPNSPFTTVSRTGFDMFYERGRLVILAIDPPTQGGSGAGYTLIVFNIRSLIVESVVKNGDLVFGASNEMFRMIPGGDFTFIVAGVNGYTAFYARRYSAASIVGVAATSAETGGQLSVYTQLGTYGLNALKGSPSKAFDHSAASIPGNKGNLLNYGVVLKGY